MYAVYSSMMYVLPFSSDHTLGILLYCKHTPQKQKRRKLKNGKAPRRRQPTAH